MASEKRVAVVTGGGSGLGAAIAGVLAADGFAVVVLDIDAARAEASAKSLRDLGQDALSAAVDVADPASVHAAAEAVRDEFGGCDVLCANVGVQQFGALERLTMDDWRWVMSVNVLGTVNTVTAFLPLLRARTGPRSVLLTASAAVYSPSIRLGAYTTSKFAVVGFGETLRMELEPEGIGVSILFPDGMATRHLESSKLARPAELGPSLLLDEDLTTMLESRGTDPVATVVTPEFAVRNLLADLAGNEPYIITHGAYRDELVRRQQAVVDAFDRMAAGEANG